MIYIWNAETNCTWDFAYLPDTNIHKLAKGN